MSTPGPATVRYAMMRQIEYKCRSGRPLDAPDIEAIRQDPSMLTDTALGHSVIAAAGTSRSSAAIQQMSAEGLITPEMLAKGSGCWTGVNYEGAPREVSNFELLLIRGKESSLDPAVYRKALANHLRKQESTLPPEAARSERRRARLAQLYTVASTGRKLTAAQAAAVKADPYLLTDVAGDGMSALSAAAHFARALGSSATLTSMLATGALTPALLLTPAYRSNFESPPTHLEFIQGRKAEGLLDPTVYRKAVAMSLRKEESLDAQRQWTADRLNTLWQVKWRSSELGWGESGLAEIEADPELVLGPQPENGLLYRALVMAKFDAMVMDKFDSPALIQELKPYITPEMLVAKMTDNDHEDMLSLAIDGDTARYFDPKVIRQAIAMKHRREESLTEAAWHHPAWKNRIMRLSELAYTGDPMTADDVKMVKDNPGVLTSAEPGFGVMLTFIAHRAQSLRGHSDNRPTLLQHLTDHNLITADMLMMPALVLRAPDKSPTILDVITDEGAAHMLDPKIVRQATAMKLSKSESLARRVISQLI